MVSEVREAKRSRGREVNSGGHYMLFIEVFLSCEKCDETFMMKKIKEVRRQGDNNS